MAHAHESHGEHKGFREFPKGHPLPIVANKRGHHALFLREGRWRLDLLPPFAIQRVKKRHKIALLLSVNSSGMINGSWWGFFTPP